MRVESRVLGRGGVRVVRKERGEDEEGAVDERPRSVYEILTRRMLEGLREDVAEVKGRVNTLLWMVVGATLLDVVMRLLG